MTGDTTTSGSIRVWGDATLRSVEWNGTTLSLSSGADGSLSGTVPGPAPVTLPALTGSSGHAIFLFERSVPLAAGKTVQAVQLPSLRDVAGYNPALHIFAMAIG